MAEDKGCLLEELSLQEMQTIEKGITEDVYNVLSVEASAGSRVSYGGTAPENVLKQADEAKERFLK